MTDAWWTELMRKANGQTLFLAVVVVIAMGFVGYLTFFHTADEDPRADDLTLAAIPFNGQRAFGVLEQLCAFGPRWSGSPGMVRQRQYLADHFTKLGARVTPQTFQIRHPETGTAVEMVNLLVEWHPAKRERILFVAHYDTRPFPDRDPRNPRGVFLGANDGASGVAVLAELGRALPEYQGRYGVDFLLVDGEELIYDNDRDEYFHGSKYFAGDYKARPPAHRYVYGVLLDMVGDANLQIYQEENSVTWEDTRPLVDSIWATARRIGVRDFVARVRHNIRDDHLPLHDIAGIPTCNIIDFDYPRPGEPSHWHTEADVPANCSALSLAKVGWVMQAWLETMK